MPLGDLFTPELWKSVADGLRGVAGRWWDENKDDLVALTKEEVEDVLRALKRGDTRSAKIEIAQRMSREEWVSYRDGTTDQLHGIAARRAAILEALEDLGRRVARLIGGAAADAIGL